MKREIYLLNPKDNVGVALTELNTVGQHLYLESMGKKTSIKLQEKIPFGHKIAIKDINSQDDIVKYGEEIGFATKDIKAGQWVHTHNIRSLRGK